MSDYLIKGLKPFSWGYTPITQIGEKIHDTGINFGIHKIKKGEKITIKNELECAYLLLDGSCIMHLKDQEKKVSRQNLFDEGPAVLHVSKKSEGAITALSDCEFAVSETHNDNDFQSVIFTEDTLLENEYRGKGILSDTACRIVRTVFDTRNNPLSNLVLGEVITAPGRWSSYPPHHHLHPEIYHYRFTEIGGYGHSECGEEVFKVQTFDTLKILDENDHAQTAAPGYGMYYLWVIRHLENNPYIQPTFSTEHEWTRHADANQRVWKSHF